MKTNTYSISGMTCNGCVSTVTSALSDVAGVEHVQVDLESGSATIQSKNDIDVLELQNGLTKRGHYLIANKPTSSSVAASELPEVSASTYFPLFLIVAFIATVSALSQWDSESFSSMLWMRHFMAGFFIVFAFFKLLNIKGFANTYRMYDIVAEKIPAWGFLYPFVELMLGVAYLINFKPFAVNLATVLILGISSIGVIRANLRKDQIKCACLGDVFNLPMSTVTIIEDLTMVAMALVMLLK